LDYLREVVIDDKLNIGADLDNEMTNVVGTYQCEWKTTIESPEKLKRFQHFINSDEQDSELAFVRERGQLRPATEVERIELVSLDSNTTTSK
jgi:nitrite reductase (NADH) large subunit